MSLCSSSQSRWRGVKPDVVLRGVAPRPPGSPRLPPHTSRCPSAALFAGCASPAVTAGRSAVQQALPLGSERRSHVPVREQSSGRFRPPAWLPEKTHRLQAGGGAFSAQKNPTTDAAGWAAGSGTHAECYRPRPPAEPERSELLIVEAKII